MKEASVRAVRTFLQSFLGVFLAGVLNSEFDGLRALGDIGVWEAALAAGIIALVTFLHNLLETQVPQVDTRG